MTSAFLLNLEPALDLIQRADHVNIRIISSFSGLVKVAVERDVLSVPAYRRPGLCPVALVRAAPVVCQAHAVDGAVPDDDFSSVEAPPRHARRVVIAPIGRAGAASAVVHRMC